jgi:hypothetical protein
MRRLLAWCRAHSAWLAHGFPWLLLGGLSLAIVLVVADWSIRQDAHLALRHQQHSTGELMILANKICEARLDRMQGIFQRLLDQHRADMARWYSMEAPCRPTPPPLPEVEP